MYPRDVVTGVPNIIAVRVKRCRAVAGSPKPSIGTKAPGENINGVVNADGPPNIGRYLIT